MKNFEFPILSVNKQEYDAIQNWIACHKLGITADKNLYIFGAGIRGNMILKLLEEAQVEVAGFCDNSLEKQDAYVKEYKIYAPSDVCNNPEVNYILVSPENSAEIEKFLEERGYVKEKNYFTIKNNLYRQYCDEFYRKGNIEYILFGDCYFTDLDVDSLDDMSMGELAIKTLGKDVTKVLSIHGMCIPSFYYLMKMQIKLGVRPRAVAFIVNIPFCNSIQTKLPQSQHASLLKMIEADLPIADDEFSQYVKLTESRSHNINAKSFSTSSNAKRKNNIHIEKMLTKSRYMYKFEEDNENIIFLKKIIELLQENDIKPVPFFPALNYFVGIEFYGQDFMRSYKAICENIKRSISEYGVEILDMSFLLEKKYFLGERMTKFPDSNGKWIEISTLCNRLQGLR